jgi:hypothetical protein
MTNIQNFLKLPFSTSQDLSLAALSYTTTIGRKFIVRRVDFRFSVAVTENITITKDSKLGTNYDTVLRTKGMVAEQNYTWIPEEGQGVFNVGDELKIQCTNANGVGTVYVEGKTEEG